MQTLICYILKNLRFMCCMLVQKISSKNKLEKKIMDVIYIEKGSKTILASDFKLDFNAQEREDFVKSLRVDEFI